MTLLEALPEILRGREWTWFHGKHQWFGIESSWKTAALKEEVILKPRTVKKEVKVWVNLYQNLEHISFSTREEAMNGALNTSRATAVECTGYYEVEEA